MKTAKIATAICYELTCPDCGPESQVEGPDGSLYVTAQEIVIGAGIAHCNDCGSELAMPRLPKRVRTQETA